MDKKKVIGGICLAATSGLVLGGLGGAMIFPEKVEVEKIKEVPFNVTVEKEVEVIKEVPVEVEKIVEVDNGDMDWAFERMEDKEIISDAEDILEELKAEDFALKIAFEELKDSKEIFDLLEDKGLIEDEDEASIVRIYSDFEDVKVVKSDFDDSDYEFKIRVKIEDEDVEEKKYFLFNIRVEDGDSEIVRVREE